jgi:PAS domain S-box-containing protein
VVQTLDSASVLFAKNPLPMWVYDPNTLAILDVNEAAVRAYGWSRTEFLGMSILGLRPDDEEGRTPASPPVSGIETHLRRNGTRLEAEIRSSRVDLGGVEAVLLVAEDATQRLGAQRELQALVERSLKVREQEQARIAREIHDSLGQTLTVLKIDLAALGSRLGRDRTAAAKVASMARQVDAAIADVRQIAAGLHPAMIDQLGLPAALEWLVETFGAEAGLDCRFEQGSISRDISPGRAIALYRVTQEALSNVARHAQARTVVVSLADEGESLLLRVTDDGRGISPDEILKPRSLGLIGMRERAKALGGTFFVEGAPGFGTRVEVRLPADETAGRGDDR